MMDNKNVLIDLHKHGFETSEFEKANFKPENYLKYNYALADAYNFDYYTVCGSHNSTTWAKKVWEKYSDLKDKGNMHLFVQSEFTTDISKVLKYFDKNTNDTKYVFKEIHLLAAAKKGKETQYFKNTEIFSRLSDMYIKVNFDRELTYKQGIFPKTINDPEYIAIGQIIKSARNILCDKYCKNRDDRIPFDIYKNLLEDGLTYSEIRKRFIEDSFNYLVEKKLIPNTYEAKNILRDSVSKFEKIDPITNKKVIFNLLIPFSFSQQQSVKKNDNPLNFYPKIGNKGMARLYLADIKMLFGDTAYFCVAHPSTVKFHKQTGIPVSAFENVDISYLTEDQQRTINRYLVHYKEKHTDYIFRANDGNDIVVEDKNKNVFIKNDELSLVKNQILINSLDKYASKYGFKIDGVEISPKMFTKHPAYNYTPKEFIWKHFDMYSKLGKAVNCNSALGDTHLNYKEDAYLIDDRISKSSAQRKYLDSLSYACTRCGWLDLLETGTFDSENQELEIKPLKGLKKETFTL